MPGLNAMAIDAPLFAGLASALGAGLLIGIERERRKGSGPHRALAGVRTFALAALGGAGAQLTGQAPVMAAGAALIVALAAIRYWRERTADPGVTTEIGLFVTYVLGLLAIDRPLLTAGGAVVVSTLLAGRTVLHRFAVRVLTAGELRDGLFLAAAALIVLPLLPERIVVVSLGMNPRRLWGLVVLFMALQAGGYMAVRLGGARLGLALSGFASGFVSSTATIAALGARCRTSPLLRPACVAGALFSCIATVVLLVVVAVSVRIDSLAFLYPSLIAGLLTALGCASFVVRSGPRQSAAPEIPTGRAFSVVSCLAFAALLTLVSAVMGVLASRYGQLAVPAGAALAGFVDVHAAATSVLAIGTADGLSAADARTAVLLAFSANSVSKVGAAWLSGGSAYGWRVSVGLTAIAVAMWLPTLWL